jgi:hypothetical protein
LKDKKIHSLRVLIIGVEHQQTAAVSRAQLKISYPDSKDYIHSLRVLIIGVEHP